MSVDYWSGFAQARLKLQAAKILTLNKLGFFVTSEAILLAPVDTGRLRSSVTFKVNLGEEWVALGTNVEYAIFQEKGTIHQKPQAFLTPAVEKNIDRINKIVKEGYKSV